MNGPLASFSLSPLSFEEKSVNQSSGRSRRSLEYLVEEIESNLEAQNYGLPKSKTQTLIGGLIEESVSSLAMEGSCQYL